MENHVRATLIVLHSRNNGVFHLQQKLPNLGKFDDIIIHKLETLVFELSRYALRIMDENGYVKIERITSTEPNEFLFLRLVKFLYATF